MRNDKIFYLSGPMSGIKDHNIPTFLRAAEALRASGHDVRVPCELTAHLTDPEKTWDACMRIDIVGMMECTAIILLSGWSKSNGARAELAIALSLGFDVYYYRVDEDLLINMELQ